MPSELKNLKNPDGSLRRISIADAIFLSGYYNEKQKRQAKALGLEGGKTGGGKSGWLSKRRSSIPSHRSTRRR